MAKASMIGKGVRWVAAFVAAAAVLLLLVILVFRFVNPPTSAFMLGYQLGDHSATAVPRVGGF